MKKIYVIIACAVTLALFFGYYKLGGFNKPVFSVISSQPYYIYGKAYKGKMKDDQFRILFEGADELIKNKGLKGFSGAIYFNDALKAEDIADAFVGVIMEDSLSAVPEGLSLYKVEPRKVVQANLRSHYIVAPINVYQSIEEHAGEQKIKVKKFPSLEIYRADDDVLIQVPVEE